MDPLGADRIRWVSKWNKYHVNVCVCVRSEMGKFPNSRCSVSNTFESIDIIVCRCSAMQCYFHSFCWITLQNSYTLHYDRSGLSSFFLHFFFLQLRVSRLSVYSFSFIFVPLCYSQGCSFFSYIHCAQCLVSDWMVIATNQDMCFETSHITRSTYEMLYVVTFCCS